MGVILCFGRTGHHCFRSGQVAQSVLLYSAAAAERVARSPDASLKIELALDEGTLTRARNQLGEKVYATVWAAGQSITPQQALETDASAALLEKALLYHHHL